MSKVTHNDFKIKFLVCYQSLRCLYLLTALFLVQQLEHIGAQMLRKANKYFLLSLIITVLVFPQTKRAITVDDLWDLPLSSLDTIAVDLEG